MQRLFSAFPSRWPGVGLALLRAAVGPVLLMIGVSALSSATSFHPLTVLPAVLALGTGTALMVGFLTPVAGVAGGLLIVAHATIWLPVRAAALGDGPAWLLLALVSLAIALLGPGAFSLDSYLFGRREIVIPGESRHRAD